MLTYSILIWHRVRIISFRPPPFLDSNLLLSPENSISVFKTLLYPINPSSTQNIAKYYHGLSHKMPESIIKYQRDRFSCAVGFFKQN